MRRPESGRIWQQAYTRIEVECSPGLQTRGFWFRPWCALANKKPRPWRGELHQASNILIASVLKIRKGGTPCKMIRPNWTCASVWA